MNVKICLLTLIAFISIFNVNAINPSGSNIHQQKAENALQMDVIKSISSPKHMSSTSECHSYYSELLQTILESYAKALELCKDIESEQLVGLLNEGQHSREATTESLNAICSSIEECKEKSGNLDFFDCVDRSGDKNSRGIWKAARESLNNAAPIKEKIHHIQYETGRCASEAERVYIIKTTEATDAMMSCYTEAEEKDQVEELEKLFRNHKEL